MDVHALRFDKSRYFLKHGYLFKTVKNSWYKKKRRFFSLSVDGILYQMNARGKRILDIKNVEEEVINRLDYDTMVSLKRINVLDYVLESDPKENSCTFSFVEKTSGKIVTFTCKSAKEKSEWRQSLQNIYDICNDVTRHKLNLWMASILKLCYVENPVQQLRLLISLQTERKCWQQRAYRH